MPKSFQSMRKTRFDRPSPQAVFLASWAPPGVSPPSPSTTKTFTSSAPASFERQRLADGGAHPVARRAGVVLQEQALARHLGVPGQAAAVAELRQHLPGEGEPPVVWERVTLEAAALVAGSQPFVQHGERGVHERDGVTGGEDEAVREAQPRPAQVPPHRARQSEGQHHVDLRARPAGVPALAVVEGQVDALVDQVLQHLVAGEVELGGSQKTSDLGFAAGMGPARARHERDIRTWRHLETSGHGSINGRSFGQHCPRNIMRPAPDAWTRAFGHHAAEPSQGP